MAIGAAIHQHGEQVAGEVNLIGLDCVLCLRSDHGRDQSSKRKGNRKTRQNEMHAATPIEESIGWARHGAGTGEQSSLAP
jgi:hypothetical protein